MLKKIISILFGLYGFVIILSGFGHFMKDNNFIGCLSFLLGVSLIFFIFFDERIGYVKVTAIKVCIVLFTIFGFDAIHPNVLKEYYDNGSVHYERTYLGGKQNGITKEFAEDGRLLREINFKNHKQDGITKVYFEDVSIQIESMWENGEETWWKEYDKDGNLIAESKE